jgi:hypothetical protein
MNAYSVLLSMDIDNPEAKAAAVKLTRSLLAFGNFLDILGELTAISVHPVELSLALLTPRSRHPQAASTEPRS